MTKSSLSAAMAPSKWDDEDDSTPPSSPPPTAPRRKFDDEEEEDVLDSWDAADDSDAEREKAARAAAKAKAEAEAAAAKMSKSQRIAEHKEVRRQHAEDEEEEDSSDEDDSERRARLRRTEKDADLKHAEDLFDDVEVSLKRGTPKAVVVGDSSDPTNAIDLSAMPLFKPSTKDQFAALTNTLIPLVTSLSKKPYYSIWVQDFAKQLVKDIPSVDVKKVASALTTVSNEKMKDERVADKGGKKTKAAKTKASLVTRRDAAKVDTTSYADEIDDDDFM